MLVTGCRKSLRVVSNRDNVTTYKLAAADLFVSIGVIVCHKLVCRFFADHQRQLRFA